jgi:hypothetical protein
MGADPEHRPEGSKPREGSDKSDRTGCKRRYSPSRCHGGKHPHRRKHNADDDSYTLVQTSHVFLHLSLLPCRTQRSDLLSFYHENRQAVAVNVYNVNNFIVYLSCSQEKRILTVTLPALPFATLRVVDGVYIGEDKS